MKTSFTAILIILISFSTPGQSQKVTSEPDSIKVWNQGEWKNIENTIRSYLEASNAINSVFPAPKTGKVKVSVTHVQLTDSTYRYEYRLDSILLEYGHVKSNELDGQRSRYGIRIIGDSVLYFNGYPEIIRFDEYYKNNKRDGAHIVYFRNEITHEWQIHTIRLYENGENVFYNIELSDSEVINIYPVSHNTNGWYFTSDPSRIVIMEKYKNKKLRKWKHFKDGKLIKHNNRQSGIIFSLINFFGKKNFNQIVKPYVNKDGNIIW